MKYISQVGFLCIKKVFFWSFFFVFISCNNSTALNEREVFIQKVEAFQFLSEYHHQLHIMIGEDDGDGEKAFQEFMTVGNDSSLLSNANFWLAETYYVRENYKDAAKNYLSLYQVYPDSKKAADALLKLGISLVNMDQKEQGCVTFIQLKDTYPNANTAVLDRGKLEIEKNGCEIS